jgi:hypothetical protein
MAKGTIIMPQTLIEIEKIEFMLDDKVYSCRVLGSEASKLWREKLMEEIGFIFNLLNDQKTLFDEFGLGDVKALTTLEVSRIIPLLTQITAQLNISFDNMPQLVQFYSSDIKQKHIQLASNAQLLYALSEMIRIEFINPFQQLFKKPNGPQDLGTLKNLPVPNGELNLENSNSSEKEQLNV